MPSLRIGFEPAEHAKIRIPGLREKLSVAASIIGESGVEVQALLRNTFAMPKENRKRGRREEKKRKREEEETEESSKKRKSEEVFDQNFNDQNGYAPYAGPGELPFYGSLGEDEQEYFKRADLMLEVNQFNDPEERELFLANVYKEASGKELKIANSQSCSRLMERLILLSTPSQLKTLFQTFSGHFLNLVQHRFASHCCEALFLQAAPLVTSELLASPDEAKSNNGEIYVSMENLLLYTCNELEENLGYLMTDQFASHPLRVLLVVLSGMPLLTTTATSVMRSKKKEHVTVTGESAVSIEEHSKHRPVPAAFRTAVDKMVAGIVTGLDTTNVRALATHPLANPVLQLLLEIELKGSGKQNAKESNSLLRNLLPDDPLVEGTDSAAFINSLVYDTIGSRLLEVIITHAPGKIFKALYKCSFGAKLGNLAKNDIAAFVVVKIIERLNRDDLQNAIESILPHIGILIERSRTAVIKTLIDRCRIREVDPTRIAERLETAYGPEPSTSLITMLNVTEPSDNGMAEERKQRIDSQDNSKVHGSLLAQCMLESPGPLRELITDALLATDISKIIAIAKNRTSSRVLQVALTCPDQVPRFRRIFIPRLYSHIADLAVDPVASHVIDALWDASSDLKFIRERLADELAQNEASLRASIPGRAVWRNWKMDLYKTRRKDWMDDAKGGGQDKPAKSGIELARERFARKKAGGGGGGQYKSSRVKAKRSTGVNNIPLKVS